MLPFYRVTLLSPGVAETTSGDLNTKKPPFF